MRGEERRRRGRARWEARQIKALRQHLGLTQAEMAEELGTRQQTISEWERGQYQPRGASARLLALIAERANFPYLAEGEERADEERS